MKFKVVFLVGVFILMLVVLVIEIAEATFEVNAPQPGAICSARAAIHKSGELQYNPCAKLDPTQVVFVR